MDTSARGTAGELQRALSQLSVNLRSVVRDTRNELEGLRLAVGDMHYFGHWITPEGAPRRYDTRFFLTAAPPNQTPLHDDHEVIAFGR